MVASKGYLFGLHKEMIEVCTLSNLKIIDVLNCLDLNLRKFFIFLLQEFIVETQNEQRNVKY